MISRAFPKAGIYFSHQECLGHTSRVMAIAQILKKKFPKGSFFFIQAGVSQPKAKIDQWGRVYSLPGALMDNRHFREPICGAGDDTEMRSNLCVDIIVKNKPDLFMTEFFPLGWQECRYELIESLVKASAQGATLWAVAGYPLLIGENSEWRERIIKLYQRIIIFSPAKEKDFIASSFASQKDRQSYLEFFERHKKKIRFAGYLLPQQEVVRDDEDENLPRPPVPKGACRVVVVRGGGAVYPKLIAEAIRTSDLLGPEYYLTVVAGPSTSMQEWYFFSTLVGKKKVNNLVLLRAVGNYEGLIAGSDVCVSMAGYHSSVMLLKHCKRSVIVPFEGHGLMSNHEQLARAGMLKEIIGAKILSIHELTAFNLAGAIKESAGSEAITSNIPKKWFTGEDVLDKALTGLFER